MSGVRAVRFVVSEGRVAGIRSADAVVRPEVRSGQHPRQRALLGLPFRIVLFVKVVFEVGVITSLQKGARPAEARRVVDFGLDDQAARALIGTCRSPFSIAFWPRLSAGPNGRRLSRA